jgi:hypothetical protein
MCKAAKGAISYRRIFLINMIEILMEYLDKHIANSIQGSYKEWTVIPSRRFIRLKVAILVTDKGNHEDSARLRIKYIHPQSLP